MLPWAKEIQRGCGGLPKKITNIKIKVQNLTDDIKKAKASHISFFSQRKKRKFLRCK